MFFVFFQTLTLKHWQSIRIHTARTWYKSHNLSREPIVCIVSGCQLPLHTFRSRKALFTLVGFAVWIWWREWTPASPYLLPHLPDPLPALWDRKPVLRSLPPGSGLCTSPIFLQGGWYGERWVFAPSIPTVWGAIGGSYSCGCQVKHRLACWETSWTAEE